MRLIIFNKMLKPVSYLNCMDNQGNITLYEDSNDKRIYGHIYGDGFSLRREEVNDIKIYSYDVPNKNINNQSFFVIQDDGDLRFLTNIESKYHVQKSHFIVDEHFPIVYLNYDKKNFEHQNVSIVRIKNRLIMHWINKTRKKYGSLIIPI